VESVPEVALKKLVERTQGIPRLLVELVRGLRRSGLVRRFERGSGYYLAVDELDRLPDLPVVQWSATREIEALPAQLAGHARLAAAFGGRFTVAELEGVLAILERDGAFTETQLDPAIGVRRLLDTGLLNRGPFAHIDFRHPLLRETLYDAMSADLRKTIHHAAYEMYRSSSDLADEERLPRLAMHAARSGLREEAAAAYLTLAERAQSRHAYLDAELMYVGAIENLPSDDSARLSSAAQGRGLMRFRLGRLEEAMRDFAFAREHAQRFDSTAREIELLLDQSMVVDWVGDYRKSAELVEEAEQVKTHMTAEPSELLQARLLVALGRKAYRAVQYDVSVEYNQEAARRAERLEDAGYETFVIALLLAGPSWAALGRWEEAEQLLNAAVQAAEVRGDLIHLAAALNNRSFVWNARGEREKLLGDMQRVRQVARQTGFGPLEFHAEANIGEVYYYLGEIAAANEHAARAVALGEQIWGDTSQTFRALLLQARVALYIDDSKTAESLLEQVRTREARALGAGLKDAKITPTEEVMADMLDLAVRGAPDDAWARLRERCDPVASSQELVEVLEMEGLCAMRSGKRESARRALNEALRIAETCPGLLVIRIGKALENLNSAPPAN
jgi:tetratricopeptide (TPR) repeat protein